MDRQGVPRVLCLHGNGTSAVILQFQLMHLTKALKTAAKAGAAVPELVFVDGPLPTSAAPGIDVFFPDQPYYKFCERNADRSGYEGIEGAMQYIHGIFEAQGPFDGIIGFSQGANVACMYAAHLEAGSIAGPPLKFVVSMSGSRSGWDKQLASIFNAPLSTPSLHTIGDRDQYKESGEQLALLYDAPTVMTHADNHRPLPSKKAAALHIVEAILDFVKTRTAA